MNRLTRIDPAWGITIIRIMMGIVLVAAGYQKLVGGVGNVAGFFARAGIPFAPVSAPFVVGLELIGGLLLLVGLAGRWLGLLFAIQFLVAAVAVSLPMMGWSAGRLDLLLLAGGLALFVAGSGRLSIDELIARRPQAAPAAESASRGESAAHRSAA